MFLPLLISPILKMTMFGAIISPYIGVVFADVDFALAGILN
jgi:hypothetical protein